MNATDLRQVRAALLARGHNMATIAAELGVSRQHVRRVLMGTDASARVRKAVAEVLGRDPLAGNGSAPAA